MLSQTEQILMDNHAGTQSKQQQHNVVSHLKFTESESKPVISSPEVNQLTHLPTRHDVHLSKEQVWYTNVRGQYELLSDAKHLHNIIIDVYR